MKTKTILQKAGNLVIFKRGKSAPNLITGLVWTQTLNENDRVIVCGHVEFSDRIICTHSSFQRIVCTRNPAGCDRHHWQRLPVGEVGTLDHCGVGVQCSWDKSWYFRNKLRYFLKTKFDIFETKFERTHTAGLPRSTFLPSLQSASRASLTARRGGSRTSRSSSSPPPPPSSPTSGSSLSSFSYPRFVETFFVAPDHRTNWQIIPVLTIFNQDRVEIWEAVLTFLFFPILVSNQLVAQP